jgi:hypothetical protein
MDSNHCRRSGRETRTGPNESPGHAIGERRRSARERVAERRRVVKHGQAGADQSSSSSLSATTRSTSMLSPSPV